VYKRNDKRSKFLKEKKMIRLLINATIILLYKVKDKEYVKKHSEAALVK